MVTAQPSSRPAHIDALIERIDGVLPQTQCTRCGYPDCRAYAEAIVLEQTAINRCPPGGAEGIDRLAQVTARPALCLDEACGTEAPRRVAVIDESWCIGCTLCIKACPVDCIVGAPKLMHTVMEAACTGCDLCVPACPVDCIEMVALPGDRTGWQAWSPEQADESRQRYAFHVVRTARDRRENDERLALRAAQKLADLQAHSSLTDPVAIARKKAVIEAALARAKAAAADAS